MTNITIEEIQRKSIWSVRGKPQREDGTYSYGRIGLYIMPLGCTSQDVVNKFLATCGKDNFESYPRGDIREVLYIGFVEIND